MGKEDSRRPRFHVTGEAGRSVCPHCGVQDGRRNGTRKGKQMFLCYSCRRTWFGEMPMPPLEQTCPYCNGYCIKHGTMLEPLGAYRRRARAAERTLLENGVGFVAGSVVARERVPCYQCTVCKRCNAGLQPERRPYCYAERCPYPVRLLLDAAAEQGLHQFCQRHGLSEAQAVRRIFAEAGAHSGRRRGAAIAGSAEGKCSLPRLPNGNIPLWESRRGGRTFGKATVGLTAAITVNLDRRAYLGLLATIRRRGLTRQEAARRLLSGLVGD